MDEQGFKIGPWCVRPRLLRIDGEQGPRSLRPKVMDLLLTLAERPGQCVTKNEILERVWQGSVVGDEVLRRTVFELRKVLDDDPKSPRFVETIPRVGYRLIAPVSEPATRGPTSEQAIPGPSEYGSADAENIGRETAGEASSGSPRRLAAAAVLVAATGVLGLLRFSGQPADTTLPAVAPLPMEAAEDIEVGGDPGADSELLPARDFSQLKIRPLTSLPGQESQPELSRDGQQLAFIARSRNADSDLYFLELDGADGPVRLTDDDAVQAAPTFDPNGRQLAYFHHGSGAPEVWLHDLERGDARPLLTLPTSDLEDLAWSPDGRWLAAALRSRPGAPMALHLYSFATRELTPLTDPPPGFVGDSQISWSPDSRTLAFARARDQVDSHLYTVELTGESTVRRITKHSAFVRGNGWNRSGDALYYLRYEPGRRPLWRVPLAGGPESAVAELGEQSMELAVAAEGGRLVFSEGTVQANIWRLALDREAEPEPVIVSTAVDGSPALSPDGSQLAFISNRSGFFELWTADGDGANPRRRTWFEGPLLRYPRWSPDGQRLAVGVYSGASADIFLVPVVGAPEPITTDPALDILPTFSAAGDAIYFASDRSGDWQVWRLPAAGGTPEQVTENGGYRALDLGPRGLVFSRHRQPQLFRLGPDGAVETIIEIGERSSRERWALSGDTVYYFRPEGSDLVRRQLGDDRIQSLARVDFPLLDPGVFVSQDGRYLLWTAIESLGSDIKLLEGFTGD